MAYISNYMLTIFEHFNSKYILFGQTDTIYSDFEKTFDKVPVED